MDKRLEKAGKEALFGLSVEVETTETKRILVDAGDLEALIRYTLALHEEPAKVTKDVYLRGDWYVSILKMDLTEEQVGFLSEIGKRTEGVGSNTIEVQEHNPAYPERNWRGHTRVE